jgi:predicted AAA+ superfamily ATPase
MNQKRITVYIQGELMLEGEKTIKREFANLSRTKDNYRKLVITFDHYSESSCKGVEVMHLSQFLLSENL